jgi:hypothetical protein
MNPFLEQVEVWHDFHERFLPLAAEFIGAQVQPDYVVRIDEHVYVRELPLGSGRLLGRPDLSVARRREASELTAGTAVIEAPARIRLPAVDIERENFLEIRDRRSRELVCVVELLSPSNKGPGPDREQYLAKRGQILASSAHLVEIDLLRGGDPMPSEDRPRCLYSAMVARADDRPVAEFWPLALPDPLPVVSIPLRAPHPDARLDLQDILNRIYDAAGYHYDIYDGAPSPALSPDEAEWARGYVPSPSQPD